MEVRGQPPALVHAFHLAEPVSFAPEHTKVAGGWASRNSPASASKLDAGTPELGVHYLTQFDSTGELKWAPYNKHSISHLFTPRDLLSF